MMVFDVDAPPATVARAWAGALGRAVRAGLTWALAWALMLGLDGQVDLAGQAMMLVLAAAIAALWLPLWASLSGSVLAVAAFNWLLVPPRGSFEVDVHAHALLLATMLLVSVIVTALMASQRRLARQLQMQAAQATQLRELGEALRAVDTAEAQAAALHQVLAEGGAPAPSMMWLLGALPAQDEPEAVRWHGTPADADTRAGLWLCLRGGRALGPGTGRHEDQPVCYLPLRGRSACQGALAMRRPAVGADAAEAQIWRAHAQALCDQLGMALEQAQAARAADEARQQAQTQSVRNALLAAVSHDLRTPLATLLGAASSLQEQGERLSPAQRQRLATTLVDELAQLSRLTDNTLQLARLEAPGLQLRRDWESAEELIGAAMQRGTRRLARSTAGAPESASRLRARVEPGLPLLRCDALLLAQLLDNLVDNALKYSAAPAPVELLARQQGGHLMLAVRDRGPGVPRPWRERVFEVFQRGPQALAVPTERGGAGVGLAVCRAIARAHGGELRLRARAHGGSSFELWLPLDDAAPPPLPDPPAGAPE